MPSLLEVLAKISLLLETVKGWKEADQALSLKQLGLSQSADQIFLSGKMLKERSPQIIAKTLQQSCKRLPTLGVIDLNGNCLIQAGFYPKIERESTLSDILQKKGRGQIFPIGDYSKKNNVLQVKHPTTATLIARYTALGSGSYIVERQVDAQEVIVKANTKKGFEIAKTGDSINIAQPNSKTRRGRVGKQQAQTLDTHCEQAVVSYTRDSKGKVTNYHEKDSANTIHSSSGGGGNTSIYNT